MIISMVLSFECSCSKIATDSSQLYYVVTFRVLPSASMIAAIANEKANSGNHTYHNNNGEATAPSASGTP
ncbi:hypothetical protein IC235_06710 [Hymenobacter sp. BT664]|uniref:Uncharacterized protein n=1 Tax=Hymenobacter montanus TaxID=2771359 RepID=A0A927BC65_9BACT|nr:hypothetical protein [Hymenobacter montanus]